MSICIWLCLLAAVHSLPRRARANTIMIPMIYLGLSAVADKHTVHWDSTWTHSLLRGPAVETMKGGASIHVSPSDVNGSCRPPPRLRGTVRPLTQTTMLHEVFRIPSRAERKAIHVPATCSTWVPSWPIRNLNNSTRHHWVLKQGKLPCSTRWK